MSCFKERKIDFLCRLVRKKIPMEPSKKKKSMFSPCFSVARRVYLLKLKVRSRDFSERGLGGHCGVIMTSFYNSFRVVALGTAGVPQGSRCPPSAGTPCCPEVPGGGSEAAAPHVPTVWGRHAAWSRDLWAVAQTVAAGPQGQPHPSVPCARDPGGSRGAGGASSGQAQGAESRGGRRRLAPALCLQVSRPWEMCASQSGPPCSKTAPSCRGRLAGCLKQSTEAPDQTVTWKHA